MSNGNGGNSSDKPQPTSEPGNGTPIEKGDKPEATLIPGNGTIRKLAEQDDEKVRSDE